MSLLLFSHFIPIVDVNQSSPNLPVLYSDLFQDAFNFTHEELNLIEQNKFLVLNRMGTDDILDAYRYYWKADLPIFITTDTLLHTWHLAFDETLIDVESLILYPLLLNLSQAMIQTALAEFSISNEVVNDVLIYLAVAERLVNPSAIAPPLLQDAVNQIVSAIMAEITIFEARGQLSSDQLSRFIDDFSQYKPRGHYTRSERLQAYFRLFKWLSRIPFLFDHYCSEHILKRTPEEMIQSAVILVWILKNTVVDIGGNPQLGIDIWKMFKEFLDVIIGKTYSVTPIMLDQVCSETMDTPNWHPSIAVADLEIIATIQSKILQNDSIPAPRDMLIVDGLVPGCPSSPKMLLLFGERLTLDTYSLNHLVYPYVGNRLMPVALDVVATCLNSERAYNLVKEEGYIDQVDTLREEIRNWSEEDKTTVYWRWLESLSHLTQFQPEINDSDKIYIPPFMKSGPWRDEKLTTVLGSYAQLRHDTILYAKQSMTQVICSTPEGYVEPYPEFYRALKDLSKHYSKALENLLDLGDITQTLTFNLYGLDLLIKASAMLESIAYRELKNLPLTDVEKQFIQDTYCESGVCGGPFLQGWLSEIIGLFKNLYRVDAFPNIRTSLVADIHTDLNTGNVLEIATGVLEHLVAVVPNWNGSEMFAVGPVFSYYEFITPMSMRMTDEDWRGILASRFQGNDDYDYTVFPRGFWAKNYMISTEMTTDIIYEFEESPELTPPTWFQTQSINFILDPYSSYTLVQYNTQITDDGHTQITDDRTSQHFSSETKTRPLEIYPILIILALVSVSVITTKKKK